MTNATRKYRAIPHPSPDIDSVLDSLLALKEVVEVLTSQRGTRISGVVTFQDLVDLELIDSDQVPT
jgi:hypothetical protein